jgi:hypothetical protein
MRPLLPGHFAHHGPQEIAGVAAIVQNLRFHISAIQSGNAKQTAPEPNLPHSFPVFADRQITKSRRQKIENIRFAQIERKTSG